jgi:hypothetical protein
MRVTVAWHRYMFVPPILDTIGVVLLTIYRLVRAGKNPNAA